MKKTFLTIIIFILTLFIGVFSVNAEYNPIPYEYEAIEKKIVERGEWKVNDTIKNDIFIDENGQMRLDEKVGKYVIDNITMIGTDTGQIVRYGINSNLIKNILLGVDVFNVFIPNYTQTLYSQRTLISSIGSFYTTQYEIAFIFSSGTTLQQAKDILIGKVIYYQLAIQNPKDKILQDSDIVGMNTSLSNVDLVVITQPSDSILLSKTLNTLYSLEGYSQIASSDNNNVSSIGKTYTNGTNQIFVVVAKGTTITQARTTLKGKKLTYQLSQPNLVTTIMMRLIYEDVYANGYNDGYEIGYDSGHEIGYIDGHALGDKNGYERGLSQATPFSAMPTNLFKKGEFTSGNAYSNRLYWDTSGLLTYNQNDKYLMIQFDDFNVIDQFNIYFVDSNNNSLPKNISYVLKGDNNPKNVKKIDGLAADWSITSYIIDLNEFNLINAKKYKIDFITTPSPQGLWVDRINNTLNTSSSNYWSVFYSGLDNVIYENAYKKGQVDADRTLTDYYDNFYKDLLTQSYERGRQAGEVSEFNGLSVMTNGFFAFITVFGNIELLPNLRVSHIIGVFLVFGVVFFIIGRKK